MNNTFDITGMTCSACSSAVSKSVLKLDFIDDVSVNLMTNSMKVTYDDSKITSKEIIQAVKNAGYDAKLQNDIEEKDAPTDIWQEQLNSMSFRLKISIPLTVLLMYVSMGHMVGLPLPNFLMGTEGSIGFAFTQFLISLPVVFVNRAYFEKGFKSLIKKSPNMDSLIAIGSLSSLIYGIFAIYKMSYALGANDLQTLHHYHHNLYFESAVMILTLITLGKYFETKSKSKTSEAVSSLLNLRPNTAHLVKENSLIDIPVDEVCLGDILQVNNGESIPVDGTIMTGQASIDESSITGESIPVEKTIDSKVIGATINKNGVFTMKVTSVGSDTVLSKIIELVKEASSTKAPIESIADKVSGIFVPIVITLSILTFLTWYIIGVGSELAMNMAISVLVISCPCALGLATPVAILVGTGQGAKNGLLFKDAKALEVMHNVDTIVFDKTGTLTQGTPVVTDVLIADTVKKDDFLISVLSIEQNSSQPLAKAIVDYCKSLVTAKMIENFEEVLGRGVKGRLSDKNIIVGNLAFMSQNQIDTDFFTTNSKSFVQNGKTPVFIAINNEPSGIIALSDIVKNTSKSAIHTLQSMGITTVMLTGDNAKTAKYISDSLGIDKVYSDVLPTQKDEVILELKNQGLKVAMVGDGINDSPALTRADVGIAIGAGTDIAIQSADIILMKNDIQDVITSLKLSRATLTNIKQNLFWAFFYNILCIPLAMGVFYNNFNLSLNPMIASLAMSFSSVFVVSNALRLRKFKINSDIKYIKQDIDTNVNIKIIPYTNTPVCENIALSDNDVKHMEISDISHTTKADTQKTDNSNENPSHNVDTSKSNATIITIDGMSCVHCKNRVEQILNTLYDTKSTVDLDKKTATFYSDVLVDDDALKTTIKDAGYSVIDIEHK